MRTQGHAQTTTGAGRQTASPGRRAALYGALVAMALVAGYIETLIPLPVAIPGVKLGIGNVVVLFAIERLGARRAFLLMLFKVSASSVLFGNPQIFIFSLSGGLLSWAVMSLAAKSGLFSAMGASVLGGVSHNAGQLIMVALVLTYQVALVNAPILAVSGVICGLAVGALAQALLNAIPQEAIHA